MTDNFYNALNRAKHLLNSTDMHISSIILEVVDEYHLTQYEYDELSDELHIFNMGICHD